MRCQLLCLFWSLWQLVSLSQSASCPWKSEDLGWDKQAGCGGGAVHGIGVRSYSQKVCKGGRWRARWDCRLLCEAGPTRVHRGTACGAELGGGDRLSIWGSRWAGGMAAGDWQRLGKWDLILFIFKWGKAKKKHWVGLSSWTQFFLITTEDFHFLIKMVTRG